jgi:hypothetical protein
MASQFPPPRHAPTVLLLMLQTFPAAMELGPVSTQVCVVVFRQETTPRWH